MLLMAWEQRALVIMMDGVDEAAGERETVEEFLHFELVPSGNRVVVTSRPTGVNRELYDRYWVVVELLPLTNELQRRVIKMQMKGNKFFDFLMTLVPLRQEAGDEDAFVDKLVKTEAYQYFLSLQQLQPDALQVESRTT